MVDKAPRKSSVVAEPSSPASGPEVPRRPRVLLVLLAAGVISVIAGILSHAAGNNVPAAILAGGGAFAGTVGLVLAIVVYAGAK